jgi:hypothetical protein
MFPADSRVRVSLSCFGDVAPSYGTHHPLKDGVPLVNCEGDRPGAAPLRPSTVHGVPRDTRPEVKEPKQRALSAAAKVSEAREAAEQN